MLIFNQLSAFNSLVFVFQNEAVFAGMNVLRIKKFQFSCESTHIDNDIEYPCVSVDEICGFPQKSSTHGKI